MELSPAVGVGVSDLQHAARAEIRRIIKETKGDELAQTRLLLGRLRDLELITEKELAALGKLAEISQETGAGKRKPGQAYLASRDVYNELLAGGRASPVALALASSAVGAYSATDDPDGSGGVVFAKSGGGWEGRGAAAGAVIGSVWGPAGAAIGGAVGGIVGHAVDECTK